MSDKPDNDQNVSKSKDDDKRSVIIDGYNFKLPETSKELSGRSLEQLTKSLKANRARLNLHESSLAKAISEGKSVQKDKTVQAIIMNAIVEIDIINSLIYEIKQQAGEADYGAREVDAADIRLNRIISEAKQERQDRIAARRESIIRLVVILLIVLLAILIVNSIN
ncbi:MAG: hypothetical protein H6628_06375 [Calditrichae bacterium]|nr:hypothetical protein [Calditrichia bacterium]